MVLSFERLNVPVRCSLCLVEIWLTSSFSSLPILDKSSITAVNSVLIKLVNSVSSFANQITALSEYRSVVTDPVLTGVTVPAQYHPAVSLRLQVSLCFFDSFYHLFFGFSCYFSSCSVVSETTVLIFFLDWEDFAAVVMCLIPIVILRLTHISSFDKN